MPPLSDGRANRFRRAARTLALLIVASHIGLIAASDARATGGSSIGSAPSVVYGQQEFGNTVTDEGGERPDCDTTRGPGRSWWMLPVIADDRVTIDLEGKTEGDGFLVNVYPLGTNQFNVGQSKPFASTVNHQENKEELSFTAPATGTMPMGVATCDAVGTYNFTAYVVHVIRLGLPHPLLLRRKGLLSVSVHSPDGGIISDPALRVIVQVGGNGSWWNVGSSSVTDSVAAIRMTIPTRLRGRLVKLRVIAGGGAYQPLTIIRGKVRVQNVGGSSHNKRHHINQRRQEPVLSAATPSNQWRRQIPPDPIPLPGPGRNVDRGLVLSSVHRANRRAG